MSLTPRGVLAGTAALAAAPAFAAPRDVVTLPDRGRFRYAGTYLDAAFTHLLGRFAARK